jgi:hypothetical protein
MLFVRLICLNSRPNIKNAVSKVNTVARTLIAKWAEQTAGGKGDVPLQRLL